MAALRLKWPTIIHNLWPLRRVTRLISNRRRLALLSLLWIVSTYFCLNALVLHSEVLDLLPLFPRIRGPVVQRIIQVKVLDDKEQTVADFEERKQLYEMVCQWRTHSGVAPLFIYPPKNLTVCQVPKAGCTFWKRAFRYLYKDYDRLRVHSMFDITRHDSHFAPTRGWKKRDFRTKRGEQLAMSSKRVMFTRDPYQRLWSAYVDKFFLPDAWADHGRAIMYRREGASRKECPDDIQFEEFLQYIIRNGDDHWRPIHTVCDPCTFLPHYVGHMETFSRDVAFILEDRGLSSLIEGQNHTNHAEDEIVILVDHHFGLYKERDFNQDCITAAHLAERLWRVFQINGYFRPDQILNVTEVKEAIEGRDIYHKKLKVTDIFIKNFRQNPTTEEEWFILRQSALKNAYRNVSNTMLLKLQQRFKGDFELFGYDQEPPV